MSYMLVYLIKRNGTNGQTDVKEVEQVEVSDVYTERKVWNCVKRVSSRGMDYSFSLKDNLMRREEKFWFLLPTTIQVDGHEST